MLFLRQDKRVVLRLNISILTRLIYAQNFYGTCVYITLRSERLFPFLYLRISNSFDK